MRNVEFSKNVSEIFQKGVEVNKQALNLSQILRRTILTIIIIVHWKLVQAAVAKMSVTDVMKDQSFCGQK